MLSLAELPPPPQLDKSYSSTELAQRASNEALPDPKVSAQDRDGWVVVGSGDAVAEIPVEDDHNEAEGSSTPARSERISVPSRSAGSSVTTLSRSSSMSGVVGVSTDPQYDPIDIGDEASAGSKGQSDRTNGKVDAVFKLHSSRRMKPSSTGRGVSIPSRMLTTTCKVLIELTNRAAVGPLYQLALFSPSTTSICCSQQWSSSPRVHHPLPHPAGSLAKAAHAHARGVRCRAWESLGLGRPL